MNVHYKPTFVRQFKRLDPRLQEEVLEKISLFKNQHNHAHLKVHKLKGHLKHCYSFSVNYQTRVVFQYKHAREAVLLAVGNHNVYD